MKRQVIAALLKAGRRDLALMVAKPNVEDKVLQFFKDNPNPNDDQVHELAESLGISPHDLETVIYGLLSRYMKKAE
jgi:hypothetical protein